MDNRNAQVGWTDAQWNRIAQVVSEEWQRVRVAGSFLPSSGPLPPSTQVVPSEVLRPDGSTDDGATARLLEISFRVRLSRQQVSEDDLSSAMLAFRRQSARLAQLEDWFIFNGYQPPSAPPNEDVLRTPGFGKMKTGPAGDLLARKYLPDNLSDLDTDPDYPGIRGGDEPSLVVWRQNMINQLWLTNPGALGLVTAASPILAGAKTQLEQDVGTSLLPDHPITPRPLTAGNLIMSIVDAIGRLERNRYVAPIVCVLGLDPFSTAVTPLATAGLISPRDRIEPLIGRELIRSAALDIEPSLDFPLPNPNNWRRRGLVLSLAGNPIDLAVALEATPQFTHVEADGTLLFRVVERFTLRIKDRKAVVPFEFTPTPRNPRPTATRSQ